jgi:hypothetical protein
MNLLVSKTLTGTFGLKLKETPLTERTVGVRKSEIENIAEKTRISKTFTDKAGIIARRIIPRKLSNESTKELIAGTYKPSSLRKFLVKLQTALQGKSCREELIVQGFKKMEQKREFSKIVFRFIRSSSENESHCRENAKNLLRPCKYRREVMLKDSDLHEKWSVPDGGTGSLNPEIAQNCRANRSRHCRILGIFYMFQRIWKFFCTTWQIPANMYGARHRNPSLSCSNISMVQYPIDSHTYHHEMFAN